MFATGDEGAHGKESPKRVTKARLLYRCASDCAQMACHSSYSAVTLNARQARISIRPRAVLCSFICFMGKENLFAVHCSSDLSAEAG
jgi:hypothetical protein